MGAGRRAHFVFSDRAGVWAIAGEGEKDIFECWSAQGEIGDAQIRRAKAFASLRSAR